MRLKLDLGEFISDERRLSLLSVKTEECKTVYDVIRRICRVFSVGPKDGNSESYAEVALFDDGFFIHPNQCSSVLEGGGIIKLQWLRSQEVIKNEKNDNIDTELGEVKRSKVKVGNKDELENKKGKSKRHSQDKELTQEKECDLESFKKKRKKEAKNNELEVCKKYKKPLEACELNETVLLNSESECSINSKRRKIINNNINAKDVNEVVEVSHEKREAKASKRKKHLAQEHVQKEKVITLENIESSCEEVMEVDSSKNKKCRLKKKIGATFTYDKTDKEDNKYDDSDVLCEIGRSSRKRDKKLQTKLTCVEEADSITVEAAKTNEASKTELQICREKIAKGKKVDIEQEKTEKEQETISDDKTDSDNRYNFNDKLSENVKKKKRRRKRQKKPQTMLACLGEVDSNAQFHDKPANILVPSTKMNSDNSRKTIETKMYNFSYSRPRNKKPMAGNAKPQNNHIIFDSNDGFAKETSIQNIDSVDDNVTKRPSNGKLSNSLWDVSDITVLNDSHYDTSSPGTSRPPEITVVENSCNEISSTSMHKFTFPSRIKKINTAEENKNIFGAFLEMSKSEEPTINTYVGRKVKEKSNNCTSTVTSVTEHQRRSPPKGVPTHIPQSDEVSCIFHNLLATQNFSQAFICPRTPSFSKLTCIKNTNKQQECLSTGIINSNEIRMSSQTKEITTLDNVNDTYLVAGIESIDIQKNDDAQENIEFENEIEEMRTFTKSTVEANIAEAKAAMNRRKRARPKAISSVGSLLNRIRSRGVDIKENVESDNSEVQSIDFEDKLEKITSTKDTNESEICISSNESSSFLSNAQTVEDENFNREEENKVRSTDQQVDLITESLDQSEIKNLENCEIRAVDNACQKSKAEESKTGELSLKDEVCVVEPDIEVSVIKEPDCAIVNASSDKVPTISSNRREQLLSGGVRLKKEITVQDEDDTITSPKKETKSYNELGEAYFNQFPVMKILPKIKEYVAVKLLSLTENLIPVYSNYQLAQVLKVQGTKITLRYIDKQEELPSKGGKLQVVDLTLEGNDSTETVDWRDVHEPRLIFP